MRHEQNGFAPRSVFVDTGAWLAVQLDDDPLHGAATETWARLVSGDQPIVTSNVVIGETYTYLRTSTQVGYNGAWRFLDWLATGRSVLRAFITADLETEAYAVLRQYRDQDFSYVAATSFAFMRSAGITEAFAFDAHFAAAGFTRIPMDRSA